MTNSPLQMTPHNYMKVPPHSPVPSPLPAGMQRDPLGRPAVKPGSDEAKCRNTVELLAAMREEIDLLGMVVEGDEHRDRIAATLVAALLSKR